jgi:hypothetical protein
LKLFLLASLLSSCLIKTISLGNIATDSSDLTLKGCNILNGFTESSGLGLRRALGGNVAVASLTNSNTIEIESTVMSKGIAVNNGYGGNFLVLAYPEVQMEMNMKDTLLIDGVADFAGNMAVEGSTVTLTAADSGIGKGTASKGDAGNLLISEADVTLLNVYIYEGVSLYGNGGNSTYCFSPSRLTRSFIANSGLSLSLSLSFYFA